MKNIEVTVLQEPEEAAATMSLAANLTQHPIANMAELLDVFYGYTIKPAIKTIQYCQSADHGSVTRHGDYTVAVVGASRKVLSQLRTHSIGLTFTSASLQYQDVSESASFFVPYAVTDKCKTLNSKFPLTRYNEMCITALSFYKELQEDYGDNDVASYIMNQAIRNVILISGNAEAFNNMIARRTCNRNTPETAYTTFLIWKELLLTEDGQEIFGSTGPNCITTGCIEGKMICSTPAIFQNLKYSPLDVYKFINLKWPLLEVNV